MNKYDIQHELEELFAKNQAIKILVKEYNIDPIRAISERTGLNLQFVLNLLAHMAILKQADMSTLVGLLKNYFYSIQECANALDLAVENDLIHWDGIAQRFIIAFPMKKEIMDKIEKFQFPLPLVVKPEKVTKNNQTGYLTEYMKDGSMILGGEYHDYDINLSHINRINSVPLSINSLVVNKLANNWKGLDKRSPKETVKSFKERKKQFATYNSIVKDIATAFAMMDNVFYLTNKYDKRGRCYSIGYHINPQGNCWNKACVEFANKELITA